MSRSHFTTWIGYQKAYKLATSICELTAGFPREERFALSDQIRRSSRSVCANLAEGYAKRRYPKHFIAKLTDAAGENYETQVWLRFARDHKYINEDHYIAHLRISEEVGRLLSFLQNHSDRFLPKS